MAKNVDMSWTARAACAGVDPNDFFPEAGARVSQETRDRCMECPVLMQCRNHGLKHETFGFWGGMTEYQLRQSRRLLNIIVDAPQYMGTVKYPERSGRA